MTEHNHPVTREMKPLGECPVCDIFYDRMDDVEFRVVDPSLDRDALHREVSIILNLLIASGTHYPEDVKVAADAILALVPPIEEHWQEVPKEHTTAHSDRIVFRNGADGTEHYWIRKK